MEIDEKIRHQTAQGQFRSSVVNIHRGFPPLKWRKNPYLAFILGFIFGIFGIGLYLWSLRDFFYALLMLIGFGIVFPGVGLIPGWMFLGVYGFMRVYYSNKKLDNLSVSDADAKLHSQWMSAAIKGAEAIDKRIQS